MINQSNVFDLYDIFVNELVGDVVLTIIIALVLVWFLSIKARMPLEVSLLFGVLILVIFFAETQLLIIWVFVVLIIGALFYYTLNKIMR